MITRLKGLNGGRCRVWWIHHGREAIRAAQLTTLVACFLTVSHFDYQDQLAQERMAREAAQAQALAARGFVRELPRVAFVLDARTDEELKIRLAEIAGDLDGWRARNRGQK